MLILSMVVFLYYKNFVSNKNKALVLSYSLSIPFTTQAFDGKWEGNEDCEEASAVIANAYLTGFTEAKIPQKRAKKEIADLNSWETANVGHNINTGADDISKMITQVYGLRTKIIQNYTAEDLKEILKNGKVALLLVNARLLNNPNYTPPGPTYHVVVLTGYNAKGFVVHDPGLTDGNKNVYSFEVIQKAAADWNNQAGVIEQEKKVAVVVEK